MKTLRPQYLAHKTVNENAYLQLSFRFTDH